jgi:hypothetical protein
VRTCPDCPTSREARDLFFTSDLWANLATLLAPFLVVMLLAIVVVRRVDGGGSP